MCRRLGPQCGTLKAVEMSTCEPLGCPRVTGVLSLEIKVSSMGSAVDPFLSSSLSPSFALCSRKGVP